MGGSAVASVEGGVVSHSTGQSLLGDGYLTA